MANPTSPPPAPSFLWDQIFSWGQSFSEAQKSIYKMEQESEAKSFENTWYYGEKFFGTTGKAAACLLNPKLCLEKLGPKIPSYLAFHVPNMAFETTISMAKWTGRNIYSLGSTAAEWVKPDLVNITTPQILEDLYKNAAARASSLSDEATRWIIGRPENSTSGSALVPKGYYDFWADKTVQPITLSNASDFQACKLFPPALILSLCSYKSSQNFFNALHDFKLLVSGQRIVSDSYTIPTVNSRIPTSISKTKTYTSPGLLKDALMKLTFSAFWGAGACITYEGIYDEVFQATAGNSEHAKLVIRTILAASIITPIAYKCIKEALYAPASDHGHDKETDPKPQSSSRRTESTFEPTRIPLSSSDMTFEEAMKVLTTSNES